MTQLIVSLKDKVAKDLQSPDLAQAFRQIELWTKSPNKPISSLLFPYSSIGAATQKMVLGANWSGNITAFVDGFGYCHLHGLPVYSGTVSDGATILTLPTTIRPTTLWRFPSFAIRASMFIDVNPSGTVTYRTGTDPTPVNANPSLDPCIFLIGS